MLFIEVVNIRSVISTVFRSGRFYLEIMSPKIYFFRELFSAIDEIYRG